MDVQETVIDRQTTTTGQQARAAASQPVVADSAAGEQKRRRQLKPLLSLSPYLLRYSKVMGLAALALVASVLAMLSVPTAMRRMIDFGFNASDTGLIDSYFLMLIGIGAVLALASSSRFYFVNWLGERVVADLRRDVFQHLATLGPAFYERTHSAEVMSRLTADTTQIKTAAGWAVSQLLRNVFMLLGALSMMFVTSVSLSLLVLVALPIIIFPIMAYGRVVRRLSRDAQDRLAEASAYAAENLSAIRTMQAFTFERAASHRFGAAVEQSFEAARKRLLARAGLTALVILLVAISIVGVLWYGASAVINDRLTRGALGQFVLYALFAAGALAELSEVWGEVQQAAGAAERLTELLAIEPEIKSPAVPKPFPVPARGEIVFRDVSFAYPTRSSVEAVSDISLRIAPGETVALVGPSGAGKSTVLNLILRFYDPSRGRIEIDGVGVAEADLEALRSRIALVPQDTALFADSIAANISYGCPDPARADIVRAARMAQADGFIRELPAGYDTLLGERGVTLSGGQRQRIAIARAILRDAPILLLDEATSALDAENEGLVQQALDAVMTGRTTLVIAHRLATVQKADRIVVMDHGRIVEQGTHQSLVKAGGLYARLADMQFAPATAA